jgi:hypothetical protein
MSIAGGIFAFLGALHALFTYLDIRKPRRIVPDDPAVIAAMGRSKLRLSRGGTTVWKTWVGFNFSHSLGLVLFGALCIVIGARLNELAPSALALLILPAIGAIYLVLAVLYWFRAPITGAAIATTCLIVAWFAYAF